MRRPVDQRLPADNAEGPPAGRGVTASDVARLAKVSRSSVSRTFTPGASVAPETRARVLAAASQLNYRVNLLARSLINQRSDLVGIVVAATENPFRSEMTTALIQAIQAADLRPMVVHAAPEKPSDQVIGMLLRYQVSGIVVTSDSPPRQIVEECAAASVPMVVINRAVGDLAVDSLNCDNAAGAGLAYRAFRAAGIDHLRVVTPQTPTFALAERTDAFTTLATADGIACGPLVVRENSYAAALEAGAELSSVAGPRTGVFCVTDYLAFGIRDGLRRRRPDPVPDRISLIGFDDVPQASWDAYQLATLHQPVTAMAGRVIALLTDRHADPSLPPQRLVQPVSFVARESFAAMP